MNILLVEVDAVISDGLAKTLEKCGYKLRLMTTGYWLLVSANSLAQKIKVRHAQVLVELPLPALEIVRWDDQDQTYFKIISEQKCLLEGDNFVPEPNKTNNLTTPIFFDSKLTISQYVSFL